MPQCRRDPDLGPGHTHRDREPRRGDRHGGPTQRRRARGLEQTPQLRGRAGGEVTPPAVDRRKGPSVEADDGDSAHVGRALDAAGLPRHLVDADAGPERANRARGDRGADGDQLREILAHHVVCRDRVGRLVVLAAHERPPIGLGEEREPDRDDHEADRDRRVAGSAREREDGEPERQRPARDRALEQSQRRRQQPCGRDRRGETDERRQQEQDDAGAVPGDKGLRVCRPAQERDHNRERGSEGGDVERREREPAQRERPDRQRRRQHERCSRGK